MEAESRRRERTATPAAPRTRPSRIYPARPGSGSCTTSSAANLTAHRGCGRGRDGPAGLDRRRNICPPPRRISDGQHRSHGRSAKGCRLGLDREPSRTALAALPPDETGPPRGHREKYLCAGCAGRTEKVIAALARGVSAARAGRPGAVRSPTDEEKAGNDATGGEARAFSSLSPHNT